MYSDNIQYLYLQYGEELKRYITRRLNSADAATDLTHETFVRLLRRYPAPQPENPRAYLYRIAHNLALDHLRLRKRKRTEAISDDHLDKIPGELSTPEQVVSNRNDLNAVRKAILEMPKRTRQVFILARLEGLTYREVSERLDISESSVQKHLSKAIKHVMQRLRMP